MKNVSASWYDFGLLLGIGLNELEGWKSQHRGNANKCWNKVSNLFLCVNLLITNFGIQVIDDWLTRGGSHDYPATWEGLYSLLNDLEFGSVAVKLKKAVLGQVSLSY